MRRARATSDATVVRAAKLGMNVQSTTLKDDETGEPFHIQQARQIRTCLWTVPNQLGVDYNAHVIEAILTHVAPGLGWR